MAKTPSYTDDQLLEAVIKYSDVCQGKIKASALARWAAENIKGMENIRDYHFQRPSTIKDPKTGKKIKKERPCTERIRELNKTRGVAAGIKTNVLLTSSDFESFLRLPVYEQKKQILEAREFVEGLQNQLDMLRRENNSLHSENKTMMEKLQTSISADKKIVCAQEHIKKQISLILSDMNQQLCENAMERIGVTKEGFKISVYNLSKKIEEQFSIAETIGKTEKMIDQAEEAIFDKDTDSLATQLFNGLDI